MQGNVLVIGRRGQLAQELYRLNWPEDVRVSFWGRNEIDLLAVDRIKSVLPPDGLRVIINTAAYTAVDKAETEQEAARALNEVAVGKLAQAALEAEIPLIHISTDYVFDGEAATPYAEVAKVNPRAVYGETKAAGEAAIRSITPQHVIVRTSWIFGQYGQNFLKTMLRLAESRAQLSVVDDQRGGPTPTLDLAQALSKIALELAAGRKDGFGTFHYSGAPATTWYDFATTIFNMARDFGVKTPRLERVDTKAYGSAAPRPSNSVLDCSKINKVYGLQQPDWRHHLRDCIGASLKEMASSKE